MDKATNLCSILNNTIEEDPQYKTLDYKGKVCYMLFKEDPPLKDIIIPSSPMDLRATRCKIDEGNKIIMEFRTPYRLTSTHMDGLLDSLKEHYGEPTRQSRNYLIYERRDHYLILNVPLDLFKRDELDGTIKGFFRDLYTALSSKIKIRNC